MSNLPFIIQGDYIRFTPKVHKYTKGEFTFKANTRGNKIIVGKVNDYLKCPNCDSLLYVSFEVDSVAEANDCLEFIRSNLRLPGIKSLASGRFVSFSSKRHLDDPECPYRTISQDVKVDADDIFNWVVSDPVEAICMFIYRIWVEVEDTYMSAEKGKVLDIMRQLKIFIDKTELPDYLQMNYLHTWRSLYRVPVWETLKDTTNLYSRCASYWEDKKTEGPFKLVLTHSKAMKALFLDLSGAAKLVEEGRPKSEAEKVASALRYAFPEFITTMPIILNVFRSLSLEILQEVMLYIFEPFTHSEGEPCQETTLEDEIIEKESVEEIKDSDSIEDFIHNALSNSEVTAEWKTSMSS